MRLGYGCTDPEACNYDETMVDDDTCDFSYYGCTDPEACNYDEDATIDDGSWSMRALVAPIPRRAITMIDHQR